MTDTKTRRRWIFDVLAVLVGGFIWAVGLDMFIVPMDIAPTGITGLATIFNHFYGFIPIGMATIVMNIPIFFAAWKISGIRFAVTSGVVMAVTSVIIDLTELIPFPVPTDPLLGALFGGVLSGVGLGVIYRRGFTTGGVDVISAMLVRVFPSVSYGTMIILLDTVVIAVATLVYGKVEVALYSLVVVYLSGIINDKMIMGLDRGKLIYIISQNSRALIEEAILKRIGRGVTEIKAVGAYTKQENNMLMVVCRPVEIFRIKTLVREIDREAFMIVSDVSEIVGNGFEKDAELPKHLEIERKYLCEPIDEKTLKPLRRVYIEQTYLQDKSRIRMMREAGESTYYLTVKHRISALTREENEHTISEKEYKKLLRKSSPDSAAVKKTRYYLPYDGHTFEIDVLCDLPLTLMEIELASEDERFELPPEIPVIREVTEESEYLNSHLARKIKQKGEKK